MQNTMTATKQLDRLKSIAANANQPALTTALFQITGDRKWISEPFLPTRTKGLFRHDNGGLDADTLERFQHEAAEALDEYLATRHVAIPEPSTKQINDMMSACMGQTIPIEYADMQRFEMQHSAFTADTLAQAQEVPRFNSAGQSRLEQNTDVPVLIVGAGVSGLALASRLEQAGIRYEIIDKLDEIGGTWVLNDYPGSGVDVPSYLYSFSNYKHYWSTHFGKRDEVQSYMRNFSDAHGITQRIRFNTEALSADFDEDTGTWSTRVSGPDGGRTIRSRFFISAVGLLSKAAIPDFPGMDDYKGSVFHSTQWPEKLELTDKNVTVIGAGASSMQVVPAIANKVKSLKVVQRSPQWVAPADGYFEEVDDDVTLLMENLPFYHSWYRFRLSWAFNDKNYDALQRDPEWTDQSRSINAINEGHRKYFLNYIQQKLGDEPDLMEASTPDYPPFGKRMLLDNGWYDTLKMPHVELVTGSVKAFSSTGVILTDGTEIDSDVIVLCTGFQARKLIQPLAVNGAHNTTLKGVWGDDNAFAYMGMAVPEFPNLFIMYGPNTNPGHGGSFVFLAECQARYIIQAMQNWADSDALALDVRHDVHDLYNEAVDKQHAGMVWSHPGMSTYYRNAEGRVVATLPWRVVDYWKMTKHFESADYNYIK